MTNILNLTGKFDKKTVAILLEIDKIADRLRLGYFIVGATARDILLQHQQFPLAAKRLKNRGS